MRSTAKLPVERPKWVTWKLSILVSCSKVLNLLRLLSPGPLAQQSSTTITNSHEYVQLWGWLSSWVSAGPHPLKVPRRPEQQEQPRSHTPGLSPFLSIHMEHANNLLHLPHCCFPPPQFSHNFPGHACRWQQFWFIFSFLECLWVLPSWSFASSLALCDTPVKPWRVDSSALCS